MIKSSLPKKVKTNISIDDTRLRSNLTTTKIKKNKETSFLYTRLGFTQPHSGPLVDNEEFVQKIRGTYNSEKPNNITGIDEIHSNCKCFNGCTVWDVRDLIWFNFAFDKPPGVEVYKEPIVKIF